MLLGAAVLAIAVFALNQPRGRISGDATPRTVVKTIQRTPSTTASSSPSAPASTRSSTSTSTRATSSPPADSAKALPLVVLNDTTTPRLAGQAAARFRTGGWTVSSFGNLPSSITDIVSTCAYYDPSVSGAQQAAEALQRQYPTIKRIRERFSDLPAGPLVVVLTPDYTAG